MNIEVMRNTLYKAYLEDFYRFCKVKYVCTDLSILISLFFGGGIKTFGDVRACMNTLMDWWPDHPLLLT